MQWFATITISTTTGMLLISCLQVSIVKDYVARQLQAESAEITKDRDTISRLQVHERRLCNSVACYYL